VYLCQGLNVTIGFDAVCGNLTGSLLRAMKNNSTVVIYGILARDNLTGISPRLMAQ
jgi:hypothetical protein